MLLEYQVFKKWASAQALVARPVTNFQLKAILLLGQWISYPLSLFIALVIDEEEMITGYLGKLLVGKIFQNSQV
mgnify:FL=1